MPIQIRMHVNTDTPANTKWGMRGFANTTHGVQELQMQLQIQIQGNTDENSITRNCRYKYKYQRVRREQETWRTGKTIRGSDSYAWLTCFGEVEKQSLSCICRVSRSTYLHTSGNSMFISSCLFSFSRDEHSISLISRSRTSLSFSTSVLISSSVVEPTLFRNVISIDISI